MFNEAILVKYGVLNPGERFEETHVGSVCVGEEVIDHTENVCRHLLTTPTDVLDTRYRNSVVLAGAAYIRGQQMRLPAQMLCLHIVKPK